ncbi:MAG: exopolysaccharide biosynthesis protein [Alphaproteobacteria bacterium]|nr:exopolysaccharide biosynthesis protein [Alphaproteobacteria bacterium]
MSIRSISELLQDLDSQLSGEHVTLDEVLKGFHERGFGFFLFIFALPTALPLPGLGINLIIALPLLLLTAQQAMGRKTIWLPQSWKTKKIERKKISTMISKALPYMRKIEHLIQPRLGFVTQGLFSNIIGILGFIMALSVCLPVPLTNTVPSLGIAIMAVGVIMRDGLSVTIGALIGTAWVLMLLLIVMFLGAEGIDVFKDTLKSFI